MSRPQVYVALSQFCRDDDRPRRVLQDAGFEVREHASGARIQREEMAEALREADAVLAGVEPYDADLLAAVPRLRCISRCGIGTDSIDLSATQRLDVAVLTTIDEIVEPVAQMTIAMILALARHVPEHGRDFQAGLWRKHTGHLLSEWTIGLIGFGRIGRMVEGYLRVFGPRVLVADPNLQADRVPPSVERVDLGALLTRADLVSLHAARPAHEGVLLGRREISAMKAGSRLVNTARGYLVDESALVEALQSGHLAGAALDVFDTEPYRGPLAAFPQVLCTPHVGTLTKASRVAMELRCALNVVEWFQGKPSNAKGGKRETTHA